MIDVDLNFELLPHQERFFDSQAHIKALVTGYGGGKTKVGAFEIVKHSAHDPGIPHMVVSPTYQMAKKTVIPGVIEVLEDHCQLRPIKDYRFNKSDHIFNIHVWNGIVYVGAAHIPDSLKGTTLGSFWVDEPGLMDKSVYDVMISRLRHPKAQYLQGCLTGTPEGMNWFYDVCEGDKKPADFDLIRGKTTDNIHLPKNFIDNMLEQYDEQLIRAYINGEFVNLESGAAYYSYSDTESVIDDIEIRQDRPIFLCMDFNYDPMTTVIAQEEVIKGEVVVVAKQELYLRNADTDASCERIIDRYGDRATYQIYPDPACKARTAHGAGKSDLKLIRKAFDGLNYDILVRAAHPKRKDRLNAVNKMLCNSKKKRKLLICKSCKKLREDMRKVTMEEYLNGNFKDPMIGHISDALGYMIEKRYPVRVEKEW